MRKQLVVASVMSIFLLTLAFSQSVTLFAQQPTVGPLELTATHIIKAATQMATPDFVVQTFALVNTTRTAIALTRDPSLAISTTPNDAQLTATRIVGEVIQTRIAVTPLASSTALLPIELTATEIVNRATDFYLGATPDPALIVTPLPTNEPETCRPFFTTNNQDELTSEILASFEDSGLPVWYGYIHTTGLAVPTGCEVSFYPLSTQLSVGITVKDLWDDNALADLTTAILAVFIQFPPTEAYGPEPARLIIAFRQEDNFDDERFIDTGYANALAAYEEGLRGEALLEALGGILPA